jgi:hypothetical protein
VHRAAPCRSVPVTSTLDRAKTVNHHRIILFTVAALLPGIAAAACAAPPIKTQEHAVCIAQEIVARSEPKWEVAYRAQQTATVWLIHYAPMSSNVRGGAGILEIERLTGAVKVREVSR